jgi:hypothetical protein
MSPNVFDDRVLEIQVVNELQAGNWPVCPNCDAERRDHDVTYVGIVSHVPTFSCDCGLIWGSDLRDGAPG